MKQPEITVPRGRGRYRPPERFHVFVSYTTREEEVRAVKPMIDHFLRGVLRPRIERSLGEPPAFYDGYSLYSSGSPLSDAELRAAIRFAIEESEVLVAFVSPAYPGSQWCRFECDTMAAKEHRPWFDVCRAPPVAQLRDRRPAALQPGLWACIRALLLRRLRRRGVPPRPGGVIVPVIWKGDAGSLAQMPAVAAPRAFDWTACGTAFNARLRIAEHLIRHGSVSPGWIWEADALDARCETSMRATAAAIVRILRERRSAYARMQ